MGKWYINHKFNDFCQLANNILVLLMLIMTSTKILKSQSWFQIIQIILRHLYSIWQIINNFGSLKMYTHTFNWRILKSCSVFLEWKGWGDYHSLACIQWKHYLQFNTLCINQLSLSLYTTLLITGIFTPWVCFKKV